MIIRNTKLKDINKIIGHASGEIWNDKKFTYLGELTAKGRYKNKIPKKFKM